MITTTVSVLLKVSFQTCLPVLLPPSVKINATPKHNSVPISKSTTFFILLIVFFFVCWE